MSNFIILKGTTALPTSGSDTNIALATGYVTYSKLYLSEFPYFENESDTENNLDLSISVQKKFRGVIETMIKWEAYPTTDQDYFDYIKDGSTSLKSVLACKYLYIQNSDGKFFPDASTKTDNLRVEVTNISNVEQAGGSCRMSVQFKTKNLI